ncbi:hypothetical protein L6452_11205 [Arctium lappa]|uniref:Uncharacterized protein n=1 Tax=Arctium lappa TaxID=4217 RepID=A0ACB9DNW4_ARCLA|nr:hypothetical protein L6452_11205 [Arctium lappa]
MTSNSSSSSFSKEEESAGQKPVIDHNIDSIDDSLDAVDNQLSSIASNTSINEEMPSVANDHHHQPVTEVGNGSSREIESERLINFNGESNLSTPAGMWRNNSEVEIDGATSSLCSSGYAGERGSSGGATCASGTDDIQELRNNSSSVGEDGEFLVSAKSQWVPGKRHGDEDDASVSWRERKKHFFVLSHSGKPIYSRYGDEHKLAGFSATLQAIISFVENGTSESFSPICLPRYNPMAFLHAYVHYFDVDTYLVLLTSSADAFFHLKDCRIRIEKVLLKSNVLSEIQRSLLEGGMRVEDLPVYPSTRSASLFHLNESRLVTRPQERLQEAFVGTGGPAGLWHFIYRNMYVDQYVSSEFSSPITGHQQQKRLYKAYQKLYASMHDKGTGPHKTQFKRNDNYVLLCWVTQDFELYAAFDPLADKSLAIRICNRVCQWVKDVENEIFLVGGSPFAW